MARLLAIKASPGPSSGSSLGPSVIAAPSDAGLAMAERAGAIIVRSPPDPMPPEGAKHIRRVSLAGLSFAVVVAFPMVLAAVYYFLVAADQYVTEFRFALRSAEPAPAQFGTWLPAAVAAAPVATDSSMVVQYIRSRAMVDDLGRRFDLRKLFSTQRADWPARLRLPVSVEQLVRYWRDQVDAFFDAADGTIVVRVRAFSRHDSLALAQGVLDLSERLVNQLSARARANALRDSESEVDRAKRRLSTALATMRDFRDEQGLIDPNTAASSGEELADRMRDALVRARTQLSTLLRYLSEDAPSVKLLQARIESLERQRRLVQGGVTEAVKSESHTLSRVMGRYEELESELRFAESAYQHALEARDQSRLNADRKQIYIAAFVPPALPEEALYPRRVRALAIVFLIAFSVWAVGGLTIRSVRDHL